MLELLNIDGKEIDLIADLYWSQQACVNIDGTFSEWFTVERGHRQGCNLSPDLSARYANRIMKVVKELDGIHIGGININNIIYALLMIQH